VELTILFLGWVAFFFVLLHFCQVFVAKFYVSPMSYAASFLLRGIGIQSDIVPKIGDGICTLVLGGYSYIITQECTGLFTCALYVSLVLAYPVSLRKRLLGLLLAPAFFVFGTLRIVIMGIVAVTDPSRIEVFHVYVMAIANLGFALYVWLFWHGHFVGREKASRVSG